MADKKAITMSAEQYGTFVPSLGRILTSSGQDIPTSPQLLLTFRQVEVKPRSYFRRWLLFGLAVCGCIFLTYQSLQRLIGAHEGVLDGLADISTSGDTHTVRASVFIDDAHTFVRKSTRATTIYGTPRLEPEIVDRKANANGKIEDHLHSTGWSELWVNVSAQPVRTAHDRLSARDSYIINMYAGGYLEGYLSQHRINESRINIYQSFFQDTPPSEALTAFINDQFSWVREQAAQDYSTHETGVREFWTSIDGLIAQFDGILDGYNSMCECGENKLTSLDLLLMNYDGDLEDLVPAMKLRENPDADTLFTQHKDRVANGRHSVFDLPYYIARKGLKCSALIRLADDLSNLWFAHTTWDTYASMVRMFKHYDVPVPQAQPEDEEFYFAKRKMSMSSSPGFLSSIDDFFIMSTGLLVTETTLGVYNESLYNLVTEETVPSWMRAVSANLLSTSGEEWVQHFSRHPSGTYNNQWMVLNTEKFAKGIGLKPGGLVILEESPGLIHSRDVTDVVQMSRYWGSYNVPAIPQIAERLGFVHMYERSGNSEEWTYEGCPRAKIFAQRAPDVHSFSDMQHLMRYNDWQHDPLSLGSPGNAISARYDLENGTNYSLMGGIDAKITDIEMARRMECDAVNGPTTQQKVFKWDGEKAEHADVPHFGQPEEFDFPYRRMKAHRLP